VKEQTGVSSYALVHFLLSALMARRVEVGHIPRAMGAVVLEGEGRL
jgi:hypothetical protein